MIAPLYASNVHTLELFRVVYLYTVYFQTFLHCVYLNTIEVLSVVYKIDAQMQFVVFACSISFYM